MPQFDTSWGPVLLLIGSVVGVIFTYFGVRRSAAATERGQEIDSSIEIIREYRTMKNDLKADWSERLERQRKSWEESIANQKLDFEEAIRQEREARQADHKEIMDKFNEVIMYFAIYVNWARAGAQGEAPWIPDWIYMKVVKALSEMDEDNNTAHDK